MVEAFESAPRARMSIKEVLEELLERSGSAVLVHTAEDEQEDGQLRARQNMPSGGGARSSFEEGCEPFSNATGIAEIRYSAGNIRESFGELVATIRREFGAA